MTAEPAARPAAQAVPVPRQPFLHELVTCVLAPTVVLGGADGQLRGTGAQGVLHADLRVLAEAVVLVDGREPEAVAGAPAAGPTARFTSLARSLGDPGPDPTVRLDRHRTATTDGLAEVLALTSTAEVAVRTAVELVVSADLAPVEELKSGGGRAPVELHATGSGLRWAGGEVSVVLRAPGASVHVADDARSAVLRWPVDLPGRGTARAGWSLHVTDTGAAVGAAPAGPSWSTPRVRADDRRLAPLLARSLADLHGLRMAPADDPGEVFLAAGAPWYLTLFGRDSLWAARMLLPLGTELAGSTLRVLAARQGTRADPGTGEAPGKIPHELRRAASSHDGLGPDGVWLPPLYYGTVDATPLWVCLLHDAWRWGLPEAQVRALLDALEAALEWMVTDGDPDGDGFLEYLDTSGHGLANQGWKDSGDAVRFADGTLATGPVALCEVQGYAHEAAVHGADLLEAFGRPGAARWRTWAEQLRTRFRAHFWVDTAHGRVPALALDADKRPVDALTSNPGHLLGTGLLDGEESARVAELVSGPALSSGFGLRTMASTEGGYSPLSYHCGSVWPHDTAIVVHGLSRAGHADAAVGLVEGLLAAGAQLGGRVPELYSGDGADELAAPVPYPAACRPQAWSAAASVALLQAALGLEVDAPAGTLALRPARPGPFGAVAVEGLVAGGAPLSVSVAADGTVVEVGSALAVRTGG